MCVHSLGVGHAQDFSYFPVGSGGTRNPKLASWRVTACLGWEEEGEEPLEKRGEAPALLTWMPLHASTLASVAAESSHSLRWLEGQTGNPFSAASVSAKRPKQTARQVCLSGDKLTTLLLQNPCLQVKAGVHWGFLSTFASSGRDSGPLSLETLEPAAGFRP